MFIPIGYDVVIAIHYENISTAKLIANLHLQVIAHARRTKKKAASQKGSRHIIQNKFRVSIRDFV